MFNDTPLGANADDYRTLYNKAIELLARREHSRLELRRKLASYSVSGKTGGDPSLLSNVLDALVDNGYQSDERFAEAYVRSRLRKGFGLQRIGMELGQRGINEDMATVALTTYVNNDSDDLNSEDIIFNAWQKKFGLPPQDLKERGKQQRFLYYRGFSSDEIAQLFDRIEREFQI